jgi:Cytochrome c3
MQRRYIILSLLLLGAAFALASCAGQAGPAGPAGPQGAVGPQGPVGPAGPAPSASDLTCTQCHQAGSMLTGKETSWSMSVHGSGPAFAIAAGRTPCVACHSGTGFSDRIASGTMAEDVKTADVNPTRIDCRACHQIHTTYTDADWALETTDPVVMYAVDGATYDGGKGNLCANCHQARTAIPAAADGMIKVDSTHWGPHHGPEAAMLLGIAGAGVQGSPSPHYKTVPDTCVQCHMGGDNADHHFMPVVGNCVACHADATSLDIDGVQTEVQASLDDLQKALTAKGLLDKDGNPVVGTYPEAQADALWNWLFISQDRSLGVHNVTYTKALLSFSLDALK